MKHTCITCTAFANKIPHCTFYSDHHSDWPVEDSQAPAIGACSQEAGPLLWVRSCSPHVAHVHLCAHRPLAGLYMVRHWQCGEALLGAQDWLAGQSGRVHRKEIQLQRPQLWSVHQGQVCHSTLLHLQQSDQRGLWKCFPEHQLGEDLFHLRYADWL